MDKPSIVVQAAESKLGCPYVYGAWGQTCTPALRRRYASYNPNQRAITYKRCPVLSDKQSSCAGCKYQGLMAFDCRGFTHWALQQAGIEITGGYVGRQWSDQNWAMKGEIATMPDLVCCVFVKKNNNWSHTGLHVGGGRIIHCSGEVKVDTVGGSNRWTHFAIPNGLYPDEQLQNYKGGKIMRILKLNMRGEDVRDVQTMLNQLGYDCGKADGCFGQNTLAALEAFQAAYGLTVDGIAGYNTVTKLRSLTEKPAAETAADPEQVALPVDDLDTVEGMIAVTRMELTTIRGHLKTALDLIDQLL